MASYPILSELPGKAKKHERRTVAFNAVATGGSGYRRGHHESEFRDVSPVGRRLAGTAHLSALTNKRFPQNPPDRLRPRGFRFRLLRDPGVEGGFEVGVEAQADLRAYARPRPSASVFLFLGYCVGPRLVVPETSSSEPKRGWHLVPALTTTTPFKEARNGCAYA